MSVYKQKIIFILAALASVVMLLCGIWQLRPDKMADAVAAQQARMTTATAQRGSDSERGFTAGTNGIPSLAPSLRGTEIDCPLKVDGQGQLVLDVGIRNCFDYFLSSLGEKSEAQLVADMHQYLAAILPVSARGYAFKLLDQYRAYKHAKLPADAPAQTYTPDALRAVLQAKQSLRNRFFSPMEVEALFGHEDAYDSFSIEQMRINTDPSLSAEQKAAKVAALIDQQPASLAESMRPLMQYAELQQLTKDIKARGGSAEELHQMRESLVGSAAANRLDQVDSDNASWLQLIKSYLSARDQVLAGGSAVVKADAITALRNQTFQSPEDRLRAQSYEQMKDNGIALPQ